MMLISRSHELFYRKKRPVFALLLPLLVCLLPLFLLARWERRSHSHLAEHFILSGHTCAQWNWPALARSNFASSRRLRDD
jgi:hypothetical protein